MMITIHGFPADIKYPDMKMLIKRECKIEDFMLGTLVKENDGSKKVRIGLSDDNEGYMVMKCLNGYRMGGNYVLKAVPVGKSTPNPPPQNTFDSRPSFSGNQQRYDYPNQSRSDYQSRNDYQNTPSNSYGNRGPQGPGPHGPSGGHGSGGGHGPGGGHAPSGGHGSGGGHGPGGGVGPGGGHGPGSQGPLNARQSQWASNNNSPAPWATNTPTANQAPQSNFNYQPQQNIPPFGQQNSSLSQRPEPRQFPQGRAQDRPFGFQPKTVPPNLGPSRQLRNIETVETNTDAPHGRYQPSGQYQQDKPVTIMKDNFQGPTQFNISHPGGQPAHYPEQKPSWQHHGAQQKPQQFTKPTPAVYEKPYDDRKYPPPEARDTKNPLIRPDTYKEYEKTGRGYSPGRPSGMRGSPIERRLSPPVRRVSPPGRRISPTGRRVSPPGRRISPPGRRISPPGRRVSPPARMTSPQGRRASPPGRRFSPSARRISPNERRVPVVPEGARRESPPGRRAAAAPGDSPARPRMRYSPGRHHPDKTSDKYGHDKNGKQVRPAYEPPSQAPNQAMYSGGYRPSVHENVQYPVAGSRPVDPQRSPWQHDRDEYMKKQDDDRRGPRMDIPRERIPEKIGDAPRQGPIRKSRSPVRRDRSPIRDRFKRHSPSPRSPRRSWALEKRRSPEMTDAPPPPIWPGQSREDRPAEYRHPKPFPDREPADPTPHPHFRPTFQKVEVHVPKWERPIDEDRSRRPEEERRFSKPIREERAPSHERYQPRDHRESKFMPREEFDVERRPTDHRRQDEPSYREDVPRRPRDEDRFPIEERRPRDDSPRREIREKLLKTHTIDKDFEDIYNRALQFKKKAEELRRSSSRRGDSEEVRSEKDRYDRRYREEERPRQEHDDRYKREDVAEEPRVKRFTLSPSVKAKRERATEEIALKIMGRHADFNQLKGEQKQRVLAELNLAVARIVFDMFGDKDVSFIEIVVKYQAKFSSKDEEKILQDVVASLPSQFRNIKRHAPETSEVPAKMARRSASPGVKQGRRLPPSRVKPKHDRVEQRRPIARPIPRAAKHAQKVYASEFKPAKEARDEKRRAASPRAAPAGGHYELSPLMTRMVEAELQDIMIKVWQELPDRPPGDAEELVVDKLRNNAGDDLRNALGLNITKRLLNVHNPLYVKIQFTGKPEKVHLSAFLKKFNFNAFKRIASTVNTFAAQVRTIADFDRICATKDIRCGNIKVTVNPCYRFTKCPSNLRTCFKDNDEDGENAENKEKSIDLKDIYGIDDKQAGDTKQNADESKTDGKDEIISKENPEKPKVVEGKIEIKSPEKENKTNKSVLPEPKAEVPAKIVAKIPEESSPNENIITPVKVNNKVVANQINVKNTQVEAKKDMVLKQNVNTPVQAATGNDIIVNKQLNAKNTDSNKIETKTDATPTPKVITPVNVAKVNNTVESNQLNAKNPDANKDKPKIVATQNPKVAPPVKVANVKPKVVDQLSVKNTDANKDKAKIVATQITKAVTPLKIADVKPKVVDQLNVKNTGVNKVVAKKVVTQNISTKTPVKVAKGNDTVIKQISQIKKVEKKVEKVEDDYDELDDHDILALMSEGIVLDECSGSDDE